jgi:hypothetical protein
MSSGEKQGILLSVTPCISILNQWDITEKWPWQLQNTVTFDYNIDIDVIMENCGSEV